MQFGRLRVCFGVIVLASIVCPSSGSSSGFAEGVLGPRTAAATYRG
jgi:hypothetical protein